MCCLSATQHGHPCRGPDFVDFLAHVDDAVGPVQHQVRISTLLRCVHKGPLLITGVTGLSAMVKRRSVRLTTAWGVRPQALSGSDKYSPPVFTRTQREYQQKL